MSARNEEYDDDPLSPEEADRLTTAFVRRVGARVRELRNMLGVSLADVHEEHGINNNVLSRIERGQHNITIHTAVRVAFALGVRPYELFVPRETSQIRLRERPPKAPSEEALEKAQQEARRRFGARVRELRGLQGMSLMMLHAFSGIDQATIQLIEAGKRNARASTAVRFADAIGVYPHELYIPHEQSGVRVKSSGGDCV